MGKHKRRRSRTPENVKNYKRNSEKSKSTSSSSNFDDVFVLFEKYKYELNKILKERDFNLKNTDDFWNFMDKYQVIYKRSQNVQSDESWNKTDLVNCVLNKSTKRIYETLSILDRNGDKVKIKYDQFKIFVDIFLLYMDFKQKEKFGKLIKLRKTQSQLPVSEYRNEIITSILENRVVLIAGDTGCGKSTQIPQYVMKAGFQKIACTQPRRIACISLAKRVAHETLAEYKSTIGYQIRFEKTKRKDTNIIFITEGLLLRQAFDEEIVTSYDVIILDEVHERHLYGDFLIGVMKCLLYKRPDMKLILMSATININLFRDYFQEENIKIIQVPGRLYPIDTIYKPIIKDRFERKTQKFDSTPYLQILHIIDEKYPKNERGDLLIFLSGIADITSLSDAVQEYSKDKQNWIVLQLHSSLSLAEQDKVFDYPPEGVRKCIISTNIAETSVTIDGVRFVIDSGKVNKMSYNMNGGVNTLQEQCISQDSAKQRSGRAGRTGPGVSYRLYSEEEYNQFEAFTVAEIHLVPLETLILQMISLGISDITNFPFLEKPNPEAVKDAIEKLRFHGALGVNTSLELTPLGEALSRLPVDLTIGKMLITSTVFGNVTAVLCLAAAVSVQSPYTNKAYRDTECQPNKQFRLDIAELKYLLSQFLCTVKSQEWTPLLKGQFSKSRFTVVDAVIIPANTGRVHCMQWDTHVVHVFANRLSKIDRLIPVHVTSANARKEFESDHGDPITLLNLFKEWLSIKQSTRTFETSGNRKTENSRYWAKKRGLEEQRFYEMIKLMTQFKDILQDSNLLDANTAELSSSERSIRHGELKKLKRLRYELKNEIKSSQKKRLKYTTYDDEENEQYLEKSDIRDVEFRISNNYETLQKLLNETSLQSGKDLTILKLILCGGLYPQIAVGDEYNYCKSPSEQLFHTRTKNFVSLHPMSYFGNNTDSLKLGEDNIEIPPPGYFSKNPLSSKHRVLVYQSLLETTKVYLMNTMRMPALQTLLLFSKSVHTNETLTKFACDEFLMFELPYVGQGKTLLLQSIQLRNKWIELLNGKLQQKPIDTNISYELIDELVHFMNTNASYTVRRLLKADLKTIYTFTTDEELDTVLKKQNPFDQEFNVTKDYNVGGIKVADYVTYKCLAEEEWSYNFTQQFQDTSLTCPKCNLEIYGTFLEKIQHEVFCNKIQTNKDSDKKVAQGMKPNSKEYYCDVCEKTLYLTPVEQLLHKKKCVSKQ